MSVADAVREAAGLPDTDQSALLADTALAEALVGAVQLYLGRVSEECDVELFFECFGRPTTGQHWSSSIIDALIKRADIPRADRQQLVDECARTATATLAQRD
ncbi:MAG: hypothetical protein V7697_28940 [Rhodococcus erythropolis]